MGGMCACACVCVLGRGVRYGSGEDPLQPPPEAAVFKDLFTLSRAVTALWRHHHSKGSISRHFCDVRSDVPKLSEVRLSGTPTMRNQSIGVPCCDIDIGYSILVQYEPKKQYRIISDFIQNFQYKCSDKHTPFSSNTLARYE